jgi:hypothetical protein
MKKFIKMNDNQRNVHNTPFSKLNSKKLAKIKKEIEKELFEEKPKNENKIENMYLMKRNQNAIDPEAIPHPCEFEDFYLNEKNENIFSTDVGKHPPHSITKYTVNETENSSSRLIRSSLIKFPIDQNLLNKIGIPFGLY